MRAIDFDRSKEELNGMLDDVRKKVDSGQFCGVFVVLLGKAGEKDYLIDSGCMSYSEIIGRLEMIKMRQYNMCAGVE